MTATGGAATTPPNFQLGYAITSIAVTAPGSGYNAAIPPAVYAVRANSELGSYHIKTTVTMSTPGAAPLALNNSMMTENGIFQATGSVVTVRSGTYALMTSDCGTTIRANSSAAITYTVPTGLTLGCSISVVQAGSGQVSFVAGQGETVEAFGAATRTSGQFAKAELLVDTATTVLLSGQIQ